MTNSSTFADGSPQELWQVIIILIPLCLLTLWIIVSNAFVMIVVIGFPTMRTPSNFYLASLASADFLVGLLILPFSIIQIIYDHWMFNEAACKTWLTLDVTLSTLSILHLVAIAVDRYRVVTDGLTYLQQRSVSDVLSVVVCLWCVSLWIATPPVLGWGNWTTLEDAERDLTDYQCNYISTLSYVVHSAFGSFIFPLVLMIYFYIKIYRKIQERLSKRRAVPSMEASIDIDRDVSEDETSATFLRRDTLEMAKHKLCILRPSVQIQDFMSKKIRFSLTKERRAARTLGIIIGAFVICWLPFCTMYILVPLVGDPPVVIYQLLTWLGYLNSAINPVVYCVYNKDFKQILQKMLCNCRRKKTNEISF